MGLIFHGDGEVMLDEKSMADARERAITDVIAAHLDEYKRLVEEHSIKLLERELAEQRVTVPGAMAEREKPAGREGRPRPNT